MRRNLDLNRLLIETTIERLRWWWNYHTRARRGEPADVARRYRLLSFLMLHLTETSLCSALASLVLSSYEHRYSNAGMVQTDLEAWTTSLCVALGSLILSTYEHGYSNAGMSQTDLEAGTTRQQQQQQQQQHGNNNNNNSSSNNVSSSGVFSRYITLFTIRSVL